MVLRGTDEKHLVCELVTMATPSSDIGVLRAAVAARALNMLPSSVGPDAVTSLASGGAPRVVTHQCVSVLVVILLIVAGAVIGWAGCTFCSNLGK